VATQPPALKQRTSELTWPGFTSAWAWLPPHGYETVTGAHPTEALEIYPTAALVSSVAGETAGMGWAVDRTVVGVADPVVVAVAGILRRPTSRRCTSARRRAAAWATSWSATFSSSTAGSGWGRRRATPG
jgi:hypothetical protein